ncbi:MAG TPA: TetR/AcrR family transcriptional regulator [Brevefilum fermentans]|jgi:AcrR family transcriptional regulator|nr:TetR/AcrR family transcriptional regulator [Brevefilum fermentans]HQA29279.1 TetR/AcrR family transcriptional regulator [Brevefilum fermentans]
MTNLVRGADTRQSILDTALSLFSKNGYDATSVAEICQQAQISKGAFYHHFP